MNDLMFFVILFIVVVALLAIATYGREIFLGMLGALSWIVSKLRKKP